MVKMKSKNGEGIYQDFIREISKKVDNVYVVSPIEKREGKQTHLIDEGNVKILRVKTGDLTKTSKIKKGINQLSLESKFRKAIIKNMGSINVDVIIYSTPPMTFSNLISSLKDKYNAISYLMLKDIFPQNALDLGMMKKRSMVYKLFRKKELDTYNISDLIGVMSEANKEHIANNSNVNRKKIHIFRNSSYDYLNKFNDDDKKRLQDYGLDSSKKTIIYGGNIGEPQGPKNIINFIKRFDEVENANLLIIGNGTKFSGVKKAANNKRNVYVFDRLPKEDYDNLLNLSDIGLIFLDEKFTIPNYPSRMTSYVCLGKPVLASVDNSTDLSDEIIKYQFGLVNKANEIDLLIKNANELANSEEEYNEFSKNARRFFENELRIEDNVDRMLREIKEYKVNEKNN